MTTDFQLHSGPTAESFHRMTRRLVDERVIERLGADAASLWHGMELSADNAALASGWSASPLDAAGTIEQAQCFAASLPDHGFDAAVVLGVGGSAQGASALIALGPYAPDRASVPVSVLDTIRPDRVLKLSKSLDPSKTLYIVASKSGTTADTMLLYRYFRRRVEQAVGPASAARHFAAATVAGSPLDELARADGFLRRFSCPADVSGRFSSFTHFTLLPAAVAGVDIRSVVDRAADMRTDCLSADPMASPGALLGAWLAALMEEGRDKLTFVAPPRLRPLLAWIEQLVAESAGKEGRGLVPVLDEPPLDASSYGGGRAFVRISMAGESDSEGDRRMVDLSEAGHPVAVLPPMAPHDVGAEMFRWQSAVVTASALAGLWPFDQPDVQASKDVAQRILAGASREAPPAPDDSQAVVSALRTAPGGSYMAVMAFVPATSALEAALQELSRAVAETYGFPVTVGYGPEFLHSTGQLHKGGPQSVVALQLLARGLGDVPVPDARHTLADVLAAQADADLRVLRGKGLPAFRLRCGPDGPASAVLDLCRAIREAPSV